MHKFKKLLFVFFIFVILVHHGYSQTNETSAENTQQPVILNQTNVSVPISSTTLKPIITPPENISTNNNESEPIAPEVQQNINATASVIIENTTLSVPITTVHAETITNAVIPDEIQTEPPLPCPAECKCATTLIDAICTGRGLSSIPSGFSSHVKMLILTSNNITEIGEDTFKERNLYELMSLLMNHNRISVLHPNAFIILKHLEVLDLGDNSLMALDSNLFLHNIALVTLRLDSNVHLEIPLSGALLNSPTLRELNISSCNITHLSDDVFTKTPSLDTIDLTGNNLTELNPNVLKPLTNLLTIHLPKSFEPKSKEICQGHTKLEKIVISNKGNEESIECSTFIITNIDITKPTTIDIVMPLNGHQPTNTVDDNIKYELAGSSDSDKNDNQNHSHVEVITTSETDNKMPLMVQVPPEEEKVGRMLVANGDTKENDETPQQSTTGSGLTGDQIDNIIIGLLLTAVVITGFVAVAKYNKKRFNHILNRNRRPRQSQQEPEGEPLHNMASNP